MYIPWEVGLRGRAKKLRGRSVCQMGDRRAGA